MPTRSTPKRPWLADEPARIMLHINVTAGQRRDLQQVARDNRTTVAGVIREAVDCYVLDYREQRVFGRKRPAT